MRNLVLISSIIDPPNIKLANNVTRSVFTKQQRYEQTKLTIESIKKYIPNLSIMIVECSELSFEEKEYFESNCDYLLNLYDDVQIRENVYSTSKSKCETTQIVNALEYIISNKIEFDNLFKISGRYQLNSQFNYSEYTNCDIVVQIAPIHEYALTAFYKIPYIYIKIYLDYLYLSINDCKNNIGLETIFFKFIDNCMNKKMNYRCLNIIGLEGFVSVNPKLEYFKC